MSGLGGGGGGGIRCEQLIYTSAERTLTGRSGLGAVACSRHWPFDTTTDPRAGLARRVSFLRQGASRVASEGTPPQSLNFLRSGSGTLVILKTLIGRDRTGRPGNFVVHALLDQKNQLMPWDALAILAQGDLVCDYDPGRPPNPGLDPFVVNPSDSIWTPQGSLTSRELKTLTSALPLLIQALWMQEITDAKVVVLAPPDSGTSLVGHLLAAVPLGVASRVTFSTLEVDIDKSEADLCFLNPQFSRRPEDRDDVVVIDLTQGRSLLSTMRRRGVKVPNQVTRMASELAEDYLRSGERWTAPPEASLAALGEAVAVGELCDRPPRSLHAEEILRIIRSRKRERWLRDPKAWEAVLWGLAQAELLPESVSRELASAELSQDCLTSRSMAVLGFVRYLLVNGAAADWSADDLLELLGATGITEAEGAQVALSTTTQELPARHRNANFRISWMLAERFPAEITDGEILAWGLMLDEMPLGTGQQLSSLARVFVDSFLYRPVQSLAPAIQGVGVHVSDLGRRLSAVIGEIMESRPQAVAGRIDEALRGGYLDGSSLAARFEFLQERWAGALMGCLVHCQALPTGYLLGPVLELPCMQNAAVMTEVCGWHWPQLVRQAGLSPRLDVVAQYLLGR
jgi:hypothetical protein